MLNRRLQQKWFIYHSCYVSIAGWLQCCFLSSSIQDPVWHNRLYLEHHYLGDKEKRDTVKYILALKISTWKCHMVYSTNISLAKVSNMATFEFNSTDMYHRSTEGSTSKREPSYLGNSYPNYHRGLASEYLASLLGKGNNFECLCLVPYK